MTPERAKAEEILSDWFGIWFRRLGGEAAVDKNQHDDLRQRIASALLAARREAREACATIVEDAECDQTEYRCLALGNIAAAIRARVKEGE